jgi:phytoene dehydrogenase-like protein
MSDYDAIVIGAGHNGLTAAAILQRGGLRTLCLEKNTYTGGMASTVELFDGYHFEIAGSVLFPPAPTIVEDLGLDQVPTLEVDVMSVNIGKPGDEPMVFYRDPVKLMEHLTERHGTEAMIGMAELLGWSQAPMRALSRFDVGTTPKTIDEMYACATNEAERRAITDMLFGSVVEVLDRIFPDKEKHAVLRGMLAFLAVNSTYRGPYTPGSATCLAFALAAPPGVPMMTKLQGGIGALTKHVRGLFESHGGEVRLKSSVDRILTDGDRVTGVQLKSGETITAPIVLSNLAPSTTFTKLLDPDLLPVDLVTRVGGVDHRAAYIQMHFALDGLPEYVAPYEFLNDEGMQGSLGMFGSPDDMQLDWENCRRGVVPQDPSMGMQIPSVHDTGLAPEGKHAASAFAMYFPVENDRAIHGRLKKEMGERVVEKIARLAPNFPSLITRQTTFASYHMETMFGCPTGDFCHGLLHPELMGAARPGPRGWRDMEVPVTGLYLAGAGCAGGPGITFIPGYNAGHEALKDASQLTSV